MKAFHATASLTNSRTYKMLGILRKLSCSLLLLISLTSSAFADQAAILETVEPTLSPKHLSLRMQRWDIDDGLPADRIHKINQDSNSHLWVSAGVGKIARFNNGSFEHFDLRERVGNHISEIVGILPDSDGRLWIYDRRGHIVHYDGVEFEAFALEKRKFFGKIYTAIQDPTGRGALLLFTSKNKHTHIHRIGISEVETLGSYESSIIDTVQFAAADPAGAIWLSDMRGKLFRLSDEQILPVTIPNETQFSQFFTTTEGELAITGRQAVYTLKDGDAHIYRSLNRPLRQSAKLHKSIMDLDGNIWVSMDKEYFQIIPQSGDHFRLHLKTEGFTYPIYQLYLSDTGTVWVSSYNGLYQIAYSPFVTWRTRSEASQHQFISVSEDGKGRMWAAAIGAVGYLDPAGTYIEVVDEPEQWTLYDAHTYDANGTVVLYNDNRVTFHDTREETTLEADIFQHLPIPDSTMVGSIISKVGDHWINTRKHLIRKKSVTSEHPYEIVSIPEKAKTKPLHNVYEGPDDHIYLDTLGAGTFEHDSASGSWTELGAQIPQFPKSVSDIHFDQEGRMWAVFDLTSQLYLRDNGTEYLIDYTTLGFSNYSMTSLAADHNDGLWFVTQADGIAYAPRSKLIEYIKSHDAPLDFKLTWFDQSTGLGTKAGSFRAKAIHCSRDGKIWVANSAGLSTIDPKLWLQKRQTAHTAAPHIETCTIDNKPTVGHQHSNKLIDALHDVHIPADARDLEIVYTTTSEGFWGTPQYRYRLQGYQNQWEAAGEKTVASYQNLPHGNYTFQVSMMQPNGQWSDSENLHITVEPHWTEYTMVRILGFIVLLSFLWAAYQIQVRRYKERSLRQESFARQLIDSQEDERKRIAAELHDSLGQDLLLIKNSTELAKRKLETDSPVRERLSDISEIATHAIKEARSITSNLRPVELDRLGLRIAVQSMFDRVEENADIQIESEITALEHNWVPQDEINIFRIIQEALNNAIKHSDAKTIRIDANKYTHDFIINISDNGIGFDLSEVLKGTRKSGLGIDSLHERIHLLNGKLTVSTAPSKGTTLRFEFPIKKASAES